MDGIVKKEMLSYLVNIASPYQRVKFFNRDTIII